MATQYYLKSSATALTVNQIKRRTGVDPTTYGSTGLASLGILNIVSAVQPFNTALYTTARSFTISGANATETWTATAKTDVAQAKKDAIEQLTQQAHGHTLLGQRGRNPRPHRSRSDYPDFAEFHWSISLSLRRTATILRPSLVCRGAQ